MSSLVLQTCSRIFCSTLRTSLLLLLLLLLLERRCLLQPFRKTGCAYVADQQKLTAKLQKKVPAVIALPKPRVAASAEEFELAVVGEPLYSLSQL